MQLLRERDLEHTFTNRALPKLRVVHQRGKTNSDGSHTSNITVEVVAEVNPSSIAFDIYAVGMLNAEIIPDTSGASAPIFSPNRRLKAGSFHAEVPGQRGRYVVSVVTARQTPINLNYQF